MVYTHAQVMVSDYENWRAVFDNGRSTRMAFGATGVEEVYRGLENPNAITAITEWKSVEDAQRYSQAPGLKEAMANSGVISMSSMQFLNRA